MSSKHMIAVVGNPNCGKSAIFNALTGLRQKVANYPGATVERRTGLIADKNDLELIDLPGTYSMTPRSMDEMVTTQVLTGAHDVEQKPDAILCVIDATNLSQHLRFVLELRDLNIPMVLALNMMDLAERDKISIDSKHLSERLGIPVVETIAVRKKGLAELVSELESLKNVPFLSNQGSNRSLRERQQTARKIASDVTLSEGTGHKLSRTLDTAFLNPYLGPVILFGLLFIMFQAVFAWAEGPMEMIDASIGALQDLSTSLLQGGFLLSLINDGILAGVGAVVVFLPQILILFLFILFLESTGYMARAAFLMDRLMSSVGLNGRAFIPLLSSFACAIPGIMAARSIASEKDRITTIMIAPLMTCSARLPVYTVIIAAFIADKSYEISLGLFSIHVGLQGLVMFGLYVAGILVALIVASILKRTVVKGKADTLMMELPKYQTPNLRFILTGLYERAGLFLRRAGTIIMLSTVILWLLAIYPTAPEGSTQPDIAHSFVGIIGGWLEVIFAPIGFNWEISAALVPGMAAREVAIAALGTVYSLSGNEEMIEAGLVTMLNSAWSLPTALSFLVWFIFAPQCLSTIAVAKRETGGWKWPTFMVVYLFALAYLASFITYRIALQLV